MASLLRWLALPVDLVLPPRCPGCGCVVAADHRFCSSCWAQLAFLGDGGCVWCARPLDAVMGTVCAPCLGARPDFDGVIAGIGYGDIARRMVVRLKRGRRPGLARTIAAMLAGRLDDSDALLVPVPLHRWRLWSRGFNQSGAIAHALARRTGIAFCPDLLVRTKRTPMLGGLGPDARRKAVRGAFRARDRLAGRHVYLVDDVLTTGATASACARALKQAGAARVTLVCWARVLDDD